MSDYYMMDENDPRAPWDKGDLPEVEVEVWTSNTLSRTALIKVNDYEELPPDADVDEDGHAIYYSNKDFRNCDLQGQYKSQHYTIKEILDELRGAVNDINLNGLNDTNLRLLNHLANEGELWTVDEEEVVTA